MARGGFLLPVIVLAFAAAACSRSGQDLPAIPAPTGLTAVGGFESVTLRWNPVTGATGYQVFRELEPVGPEPSAPAVTGTSSTIGGLPNWDLTGWRVAALMGGRTGQPSALATATPSGGWLVGFREQTGQFAGRYRSDIPGGPPLDSYSGASYVAAPAPNGAVVYLVPAVSPYTEIGLYRSDATRVTVGATPGHTYRYLGRTASGRWLYWDCSAGLYDIHSNDSSGSNDLTLLGGCTAAPVYHVSPKGVLFSCPTAGHTDTVWASDGTSTPKLIPGTPATTPYLLQDYFPEGAILSTGGKLYRAPVDGSAAPAALSPEVDQNDVYYTGILGSADTLMIAVNTGVGAVPWHLWAVGADGTPRWAVGKSANSTPIVFGVSADDRHFLALLPDAFGSGVNQVNRLSFSDGNDVLNYSAASDGEAHFLSDDSVLLRATGGSWRFVPATATGNPAAPQSTLTYVGVTSGFLGSSPPWMLFNDQTGVTRLTSVSEDLATLHVISFALASNPRFTWGIGGADFAYLDTTGGVHDGTPDGSRSAVLDTASSTDVVPSGTTADGRAFWIVTHAAGDKDTVVLNTSGSVTKILGGPTSDAGWFVR